MKYRNVKTEAGGITFDSKAEAKRWGELQMLARGGLIDNLTRQESFELAPAVRFAGEKRQKPPLRYVADFSYTEWQGDKKMRIVEDVKSPATMTRAFQIKRHLMMSLFGIDVRIVK